MPKINLLIISGTTRPNNNSQKAANFVFEIIKNNDNFDCKFVDVTDIKVMDDGNTRDENYSKLVEWADSYFIITPEYNHGIPGGLKRVLDSEPNKNYENKAVAVAGVSTGNFGGIRAVENLLPVLKELGLKITRYDVYFSHVDKFFSEENIENTEHQKQRINKVVNELLFLAKSLKWGRENLINKLE